MNLASDSSLRLAVVGDLALGGEFIAQGRPEGSSLTYPFRALAEPLQDVDILIVNLEGPIGNEGTARKGSSSLLYNEPDVLDWLSSFPCCVCTLANNHALDFGPEALFRTQEMLRSRGVHFLGAGSNDLEAGRELTLTVNGITIGLLAFTTSEPHVGAVLAGPSSPGSSALPGEEEACARVQVLAAETDLAGVLLHWGHEYFHYPSPPQVRFARSLVLAGARLVVGHHPHVQQGCEQIGGNLICHSLGNLLLPEMRAISGRIQYRKPVTKQFAILRAEVERSKIAFWSISGGRCDRAYNLVPYQGTVAERFKARIEELSAPLRSPDYEQFWPKYLSRRIGELRREELRDTIAKFWMTDLKTLAKTVSFGDVHRSICRAARIAFGRNSARRSGGELKFTGQD
jgi:poly-gamma-glutamate synthesis protein (capsule biosynthesis protein)